MSARTDSNLCEDVTFHNFVDCSSPALVGQGRRVARGEITPRMQIASETARRYLTLAVCESFNAPRWAAASQRIQTHTASLAAGLPELKGKQDTFLREMSRADSAIAPFLSTQIEGPDKKPTAGLSAIELRLAGIAAQLDAIEKSPPQHVGSP